ncbi:MAG: cupin domain-containing protein [Lachnospiraceae bacterium]|nr:cupin domain-containing protein [Lachnospiraceae bacterium]
MRFIMADEGSVYTPAGHDAEVMSRSIYKGSVDIHVTTFPPGAGMEEEMHENLSHIFWVLEGSMEILAQGKVLKTLKKEDAVYIPAGELHEVRNKTKSKVQFLAVTFSEP